MKVYDAQELGRKVDRAVEAEAGDHRVVTLIEGVMYEVFNNENGPIGSNVYIAIDYHYVMARTEANLSPEQALEILKAAVNRAGYELDAVLIAAIRVELRERNLSVIKGV